MGRLFFLGVLSVASVAGLVRPWVGVVCAYFIAILTPQTIWYWNFEDLRPVLWVLLPTLAGFAYALARQTLLDLEFGLAKKEYNLRILGNGRNLCLLVLWLCLTLSYFNGPYVEVQGPYRFSQTDWAMENFSKIFLLYFLACICINDEKRLKALVAVVIVSAAYLIYWANARYLSGFVFGRLRGPADVYDIGVYADENNFAMLFVVALPFIWYAGHALGNRSWRWALWLIIPFGWHAIFLTASRGGLIGVAVTLLLIAWRSRNVRLGLLLIPAFIGAYLWQAGDLMRGRAATIDEFRTESSAATRLEAWSAALNMMSEHPVTGVGLASFGPAFPDHSDKQPREAHNTFLQISAESGVLAGLMYAFVVLATIFGLWRNGNNLRRARVPGANYHNLYLINEATLVAFCGLVVCSLFLSLQMFEIFYFLCLVTNVILYLSPKPVPERVPLERRIRPVRERVIAATRRRRGAKLPNSAS